MPASLTITAADFYVFAPGTRIRSAQVNTNFNIWKGHILPVDPTTTVAAAASGLYDLGTHDHYWRGVYQQYGVMYANTAGSVPAAPTAGQYAIYMKNDGVLYKKDSANLESPLGAGGGALGVTGSRASPSTITATGLVYNTAGSARQMWFVTGDTTVGTDITTNPQITAGSTVGQELIIMGRSDTAFVLFEDGNGLSLNGPFQAYANSVIGLVWDTSAWVEMFRKP